MMFSAAKLLFDIYFRENYIKLYLDWPAFGGRIFKFLYEEQGNWFYSVSIKKPIIINDAETGFYDLETAYGFGGYLCFPDGKAANYQFLQKAINQYKEFCQRNNIVAEFVRFHPLGRFPRSDKFFSLLKKEREVVYVPLSQPYQWDSSLKRNLRKAERLGVIWNSVPSADNKKWVEFFVEIYYATMKKNKALPFYFFPKKYFADLFRLPYTRLFVTYYKNKPVNMLVILESKVLKVAYYHLGATMPDFYATNANSLNFARTMDYYRKQGFNVFFLGGGNSSLPNDSLFRFKRKFSSFTLPYFIAGNIFLDDIYESWKKDGYNYNGKVLFWRVRDEDR